MSRVLCVDDEPAILRLLEVILQRGGHETLKAGDAAVAMNVMRSGGIDAVLLDLGLPDRDGLELITAIRSVAPIPIIVVSAREDIAEKVTALDLGASDYVTKPFDADELLARLRAALRQSNAAATTGDILSHWPIEIDLARHAVTLGGKPVAVTRKEFEVLRSLVEAKGRILSHAALLERVWGKAHREDVEYLRVAIRALRLKIEEDPSRPCMIINEPGVGYRLA